MKIPREIYNYLAYELSHYVEYKKQLAEEYDRLMEPVDLTKHSDSQDKSDPLVSGKMIIAWKHHIDAIEKAKRNLKQRFPDFPAFFRVYFVDGEKNIEQVCSLVHVSRETTYRYKRAIIAELGTELGLLK